MNFFIRVFRPLQNGPCHLSSEWPKISKKSVFVILLIRFVPKHSLFACATFEQSSKNNTKGTGYYLHSVEYSIRWCSMSCMVFVLWNLWTNSSAIWLIIGTYFATAFCRSRNFWVGLRISCHSSSFLSWTHMRWPFFVFRLEQRTIFTTNFFLIFISYVSFIFFIEQNTFMLIMKFKQVFYPTASKLSWSTVAKYGFPGEIRTLALYMYFIWSVQWLTLYVMENYDFLPKMHKPIVSIGDNWRISISLKAFQSKTMHQVNHKCIF